MKDPEKTKKTMVISIVLAIAVFVIYGFLFLNIKDKNEQISTLANDAQQLRSKDDTLKATKTILDQSKDLISQLDSYFIPADGVVGFISVLEGVGKFSGVDMTIGSVGTEADSKAKDEIKETLRLHIETNGSWKNTFYFLSVIENLPYRIDVEDVSLGLVGATDKVLFDNKTATAQTRQPNKDEKWHGSFNVTVVKLK
jgi:Tfp pilus assembly protein PilO